jgi:hypothetical protein
MLGFSYLSTDLFDIFFRFKNIQFEISDTKDPGVFQINARVTYLKLDILKPEKNIK